MANFKNRHCHCSSCKPFKSQFSQLPILHRLPVHYVTYCQIIPIKQPINLNVDMIPVKPTYLLNPLSRLTDHQTSSNRQHHIEVILNLSKDSDKENADVVVEMTVDNLNDDIHMEPLDLSMEKSLEEVVEIDLEQQRRFRRGLEVQNRNTKNWFHSDRSIVLD